MAEVDEYYGVDYVEPVNALQGQICDRSVQLLGPKSPLESEMYSVLAYNHAKSAINIDQHSVNHVLLTPLQQVRYFWQIEFFIELKSAERKENVSPIFFIIYKIGSIDQIHGCRTQQHRRCN